MKNEDQLLRLTCLTGDKECGPQEESVRLASGVQDWDRFLQKADFHRLLPRTYLLLKNGGADSFLRPQIWKKIEEAHLMAQFRVLALEAELIKNLLPRFNQEGVEVLLLKGAALQQNVYRKKPIRSFVDLDLMIHEKDLSKASKILEGEGYQRRLSHFPSQWHAREFGIEAGEIAFPYWQGEREIKLDLHVDAFERWSPFRFTRNWLWENAKPITVGVSEALVPEPNRLFLHLLFHLLKHVQAHENILGWYLDLTECLCYFEKEIDGSFCLRAVQSNSGENQILEILDFLDRELNAPLPPEFRPLIERKRIKTLSWENILDPIQPSELAGFNQSEGTDRRELFLFYWKQVRGLRKKLIFLLRWLVPDPGYLKVKYPFRNTWDKCLAYGRHLTVMALKGVSLGFYWLRRERAGSHAARRI